MLKQEKPIPGFYWLSQSWYRESAKPHDKDIVDEIMIGLYYKEGGCKGELKMEWVAIQADKPAVPHLCAFSDSWSLFKEIPALLTVLGKAKRVETKRIQEVAEDLTPSEFARLLLKHGFKDLTKRLSPYENDAPKKLVSVRIPQDLADGLKRAGHDIAFQSFKEI